MYQCGKFLWDKQKMFQTNVLSSINVNKPGTDAVSLRHHEAGRAAVWQHSAWTVSPFWGCCRWQASKQNSLCTVRALSTNISKTLPPLTYKPPHNRALIHFEPRCSYLCDLWESFHIPAPSYYRYPWWITLGKCWALEDASCAVTKSTQSPLFHLSQHNASHCCDCGENCYWCGFNLQPNWNRRLFMPFLWHVHSCRY